MPPLEVFRVVACLSWAIVLAAMLCFGSEAHSIAKQRRLPWPPLGKLFIFEIRWKRPLRPRCGKH